MSKTYEVIIAGGGPVGWFVAHELGLAGVSTLVLERDAQPQSPWKTAPMGRRGLNVASSEAFYRRGLLRDVFEPDEQPEPFQKTDSFQFAGHFAGIMLDYNKLEPERLKYKLRGPSLLGGPTSLERIEAQLCARAQKLGVEVRRGAEVTGLSQDSGAVTVQAGGQSYSCRWLVGSDGGRSTVRKAAGFESVGSDAEFTGYAVLCDLDDPNKLEPGIQLHKNGVTAVGGPGHVYVMDYESRDFDRTQEVTREHFQEVLRRVSGVDVTVKAIRLASTFTDRAKQVTAYRRGRVVLAGDSAHIHSPLGAQGLNAGIGDAMNLGWKLAAVAKGTAPEGLLDTYHAERHPVGARVLEWSRAQVATARPSLDGHAVASMLRDLIDTDAGTSYFIDRVMGLSQRYDLGDDEPWVGRSAPDFEFVDGTRLGAKCERGRGLLVALEAQPALAEAAAAWKGQVDYLALRAKDSLGLKALLMRPDGVIAWAARDKPDAGKAQATLRRWFGGR